MTRTEDVIRSILGPCRSGIRPLVLAVDRAIELMYDQGLDREDIKLARDIYPIVAERKALRPGGRQIKPESAGKAVQRLCNLCWDMLVRRGLVEKYIGDVIPDIGSASDMVFYLAHYVRTGKAFFRRRR